MCVIIDANVVSLVFGDRASEDFLPVLNWLLNRGGGLVYGGALAQELNHVGKARRSLKTLNQAGRAFFYPDEAVTEEQERVTQSGLCRSNDPHVVALARVSGARTLCSHDLSLIRDFTNYRLIARPRGKVYQRPEHIDLLCHTRSCPKPTQRR